MAQKKTNGSIIKYKVALAANAKAVREANKNNKEIVPTANTPTTLPTFTPKSRELSIYNNAAKTGAENMQRQKRDEISALYAMPTADIEQKVAERNKAVADLEAASKIQSDIRYLENYLSTNNSTNPRSKNAISAAQTQLDKLKADLSAYDLPALKANASGTAYTTFDNKIISWDDLLTNAKGRDAQASEDYDEYVAKGKGFSYTDTGTEKTTSLYGNKITSYDNVRLAAAAMNYFDGKAVDSSIPDVKLDKYKRMQPEEFDLFAYYLAKDKEEGTTRANEYLEAIDALLEYRAGEAIAYRLEDDFGGQLSQAVDAGLVQFGSGIGAVFGAEQKPNATQYASQMIREDLANKGIKIGNSSLGQIAYDITVTSANMLPSIGASIIAGMVNPTAGAVVGNALMGTSAAGNAYQEFVNLGYTKDEARTYGILIGASEAALQYALGGIGGLASKTGLASKITKALSGVENGLARFALTLGGNAVSEAIEEGAQTILEPIFKSIVTGENIEAVDWGEVAYSALLGALSAGVFETAPTAVNTISGEIAKNKIGQNIINNKRIDDLKTEADKFTDNKTVTKRLEKLNKKESASNAYNLARAVAKAENKKTSRVAREDLVEGGLTKREAEIVAEFAEKVSQGYEPTAEETARIELITSKMESVGENLNETEADSGEDFASEAEEANVSENSTIEEKATESKFEASPLMMKNKVEPLKVTLESAASKYGAQAGAMMHTYNAGQDVEKYDAAYRAAYNMGREGVKINYVMKSPLVAYLNPTQREVAYQAGVDAINAQRKKKGEGKVTYEGTTALLKTSELQSASLRAVNFLSKALGVDVHVFDSQSEEFKGKNGFYDHTDRSIWIDIHSGNTDKGTILYTMAHELTHFIQAWSKAKYEEFADFLLENYAEKGVDINDLVKAQIDKAAQHGDILTEDEAFDEVIADSCEAMLADGDVLTKIAELKERDQSLWEKIVEYITALVDKIKAVYKDIKPDSAEGKFVAEQLETFEELKRLWTEALVEAGENYGAGATWLKNPFDNTLQNTEKGATKNGVVGSKKQFSLKDVPFPTREDLESKPPIKVIDISVSQTEGRFSERRKEILRRAEEIIKKPYLNKDTNTLIFITKDSYTHAFNNLGKLQLNASEHLTELIENAVMTHSEETTHGNSYADGIYTFFAAVRAENDILPVKLKVKEYRYLGQPIPKNIREYYNNLPKEYATSYDTVVLEVQEIEKSPLGSAKNMNQGDSFLGPNRLSTISVADLLELVKGDAQKYIPQKSVGIKHSYKDTDASQYTPEERALLAGLMAQGRTDAKMIRTRDERLAETKAHYREARMKGIEGRTKTELRGKIKRKVNELNTLLLNGNRNSHVPLKLREAVAMALEAVNMDTITAQARINALLEKERALVEKEKEALAAGDLEKAKKIRNEIDKNSSSRMYLAEQGDRLKAKLDKLDEAYREIIKDARGDVVDLEEANLILEKIIATKEKIKDTAIRDMSLSQLQAVYDLYKMVLKSVRDANKLFREGKKESISNNAFTIMEEVRKYPALPEERVGNFDSAKSFAWNELTPIYAFRRIGSSTLEKFYWDLVKAQDVYARDTEDVTRFAEETRKKYGYDKWDMDKVIPFKTLDGREMELTLGHMMSIYAYSKRPQAKDHIEYGGFFFNNKETFRKTKVGIELKRSNEAGYKFTLPQLDEIIGALTTEQIKYVDEMQDFMSQFGERGNEASRILWDIDLFKEEHYFPLKSKDDFIKRENEVKQSASLKNDGMTKETVPGASNPIILEKFDNVWANHLERMSKYHAFVVPLDNINKVFHYGTWRDANAEAVTTVVESRFGKGAVEYINALIDDLNGNNKTSGATIAFLSGLFGKFKKTAVAGSLSVVVQQPTAVIRAMSVMDAKYFGALDKVEKTMDKTWDEIKQYAPIALIKEIGGFDAGSGRRIESWINRDTLSGIDKTSQKFDDATMWGAAQADMLGWSIIWNAVKREMIHKHHDLSPASKKFLDLCGERFTEVITLTQVYDSTLSRSGLMRSKNDLTKQIVSFMGEPTLSLNMLVDAILQLKRKKISGANASRIIASVYLAQISAILAKSFVYALRDDDEEESYMEKYAQAVGGSLSGGKWYLFAVSELSPITWIPFLRDIASVLQGYDIERADMSVIMDLYKAITTLDSKKKSTWRKIEDITGAFGAIFGIPAKNLLRTVREMYSVYENIADGVSGNVGKGFANGFLGE